LLKKSQYIDKKLAASRARRGRARAASAASGRDVSTAAQRGSKYGKNLLNPVALAGRAKQLFPLS